MSIEDYYKQEIDVLNRRIYAYTEYGCSLELIPIVEALTECRDKLMTYIK